MLIFIILQTGQSMLTFPLKPSSEPSDSYSHNTTSTYQAILTLNNTGKNLSLVVDTASSWLVISQDSLGNEDPECEEKEGKQVIEVKGVDVEGKVCRVDLRFGSMVKNVQFFMSFKEFNQSDGVLGLGFSRLSKGFLPLVQQIEENEFSLYIGKEVGSTSVLTIGGFSEDYGAEKISDINAYPHSGVWEVSIESVLMGEERAEVFLFGVINSSSADLVFPEREFGVILSGFRNLLECQESTYITCNVTGFNLTNLPNLTLSIQNSNYILPASTFSHCTDQECTFHISQHNKSHITLGLPFFLQFYLAFDLDLFTIQAYTSSTHAGSGAYYTLYIIGIIVLGVIVSIPLCFWMMLSKIKGVADKSPDYQRLTN